MDILSHWLELGRMRVQLDVHCRLAGAYRIAHGQAPGGEAPFHLVLGGECQLQIAQEVITLKAGDFLLLPQGLAHHVLNRSEDAAPATTGTAPGVALWPAGDSHILPVKSNLAPGDAAALDLLCGRFVCDRGAGDVLLRSLPALVHVNLLDETGDAALATLIALLRHEASQAQPGALAVVNALGQTLLTLALRACGQSATPEANVLALLADRRLAPSVAALLHEPQRPWTIASLGERVAMSRATYARRFLARSGLAVGEFIARTRMMRACSLLRHSDQGLADIAWAVGYQSEAAFGKAFRDMIGESPGRWRRAQRESAAGR